LITSNETKITPEFHLIKIGEIVEDAESILSNSIENIYLQKSRAIVEQTRVNPIEGGQNIAGAEQMKQLFLNRDK
jgi:hypothetical protein